VAPPEGPPLDSALHVLPRHSERAGRLAPRVEEVLLDQLRERQIGRHHEDQGEIEERREVPEPEDVAKGRDWEQRPDGRGGQACDE